MWLVVSASGGMGVAKVARRAGLVRYCCFDNRISAFQCYWSNRWREFTTSLLPVNSLDDEMSVPIKPETRSNLMTLEGVQAGTCSAQISHYLQNSCFLAHHPGFVNVFCPLPLCSHGSGCITRLFHLSACSTVGADQTNSTCVCVCVFLLSTR